MNGHQRELLARLEAVPLDQARIDLATEKYGEIGSPNHSFGMSWLSAKEAAFRESSTADAARWARQAAYAAYAAAIITALSMIKDMIL